MKNYLAVSILTVLIPSISFASTEKSADNNPPIQAKMADGQIQTTVVDENGNLKIENTPSSETNQSAPLPPNTNTNTLGRTKTTP